MAFAPRNSGSGKQQQQRRKKQQQQQSEVQDRVKEIKSRQSAWLQQRDAAMVASEEPQQQQHPQQHPQHPQQQQQQRRRQQRTASADSVGGSGLLARVRSELEDIEREVRSSAGLRPMSHACQLCRCLMLAGRAPARLRPCGHTVCAACAQVVSDCPECGLPASGAAPDAALQANIREFRDASPPAGQQVRWSQQLSVISGRMRHLEDTMDSLQAEVAQLTQQLQLEAAHDAELAEAERQAEAELQRLREELRRIGERRAAARDNRSFIQAEIDAKTHSLQAAAASQRLVSEELDKLQQLCGQR